MSKLQKGFTDLLLVTLILLLGLIIFGAYKFYNYFQVKTNPETYYETGVSYLLKEKDYLAGANFHNYLTKTKDIKNIDNKRKFIIGGTFTKTGRYYQAIQLLESTSPEDSGEIFSKADYYNLLAEAYLYKNRYEMALENADKALVIQNATPTFIRKAHIIKFLTYLEKDDTNNSKKEEQLLGSLGYEDLDIFESEFYTNRTLSHAQESGILQTITNQSYDTIYQNKDLSPTKKAVVFTILATFHRQNGKFTEAEFYAKKAIEADPDYLPGYYEMGSINEAQGKFHTALEYDRKAAKIDPNHPLVLTSIGWNYYNLAVSQGEERGHIIEVMKLAEENYLKALEVDPEFAMTHNNLGLVYFQRNQCSKATESFNLSIKYDAAYPKPVNNIGATYYESQDYDKAIEYFEKSLKIKPDYARAYLNIGRAYHYMGDFQKSNTALQRDLKLDPYDTDAYLFIARNYLAQDQKQAAVETLNKAITITPDYPKLHFALSDIYTEIGETQKSKEAYEKAMSFFLKADSVSSANAGETYASSEYIYHYNRGLEYKNAGKTDQAIEAYKKAIELEPGYSDSYFNLSRIYETKYGINKSIELLKQGLEAVPKSLDLYDELGYVYKNSGDLDNALKVFQEVATKVQGNCDKPNVARIYEGIGLIYYDQKKYDSALGEFNKALDQDPRSSSIYTNLGATYIAKGNLEKALANLQAAVQLNPKEAVAHNNLGDTLAQLGKINEAILEFKKALEIDPNLKIAQENLDRYQKR